MFGKVAVAVLAAHQSGRILVAQRVELGLRDVRGHVAQRQPAAAAIGGIGIAGVEYLAIVDGYLARREHQIDGVAIIDELVGDLLINAEQVASSGRLAVGGNAVFVRTGNDPHTAVFHIAGIHSHPSGVGFGRL